MCIRDRYNVEVDVTLSSGKTGKFVVEVHPDWAPLGAQRFKEIIHAEIWTGARFFRVVRGFVSGGQSSLPPRARVARSRTAYRCSVRKPGRPRRPGPRPAAGGVKVALGLMPWVAGEAGEDFDSDFSFL